MDRVVLEEREKIYAIMKQRKGMVAKNLGDLAEVHGKEPMYCGEDFRQYVGYMIEDVLSDESDCHTKLVLKDKTKINKKVVLDTGWRNNFCFGKMIMGGEIEHE